jgi:hypothetical protein
MNADDYKLLAYITGRDGENQELYTCRRCGAVVTYWTMSDHIDFHEVPA